MSQVYKVYEVIFITQDITLTGMTGRSVASTSWKGWGSNDRCRQHIILHGGCRRWRHHEASWSRCILQVCRCHGDRGRGWGRVDGGVNRVLVVVEAFFEVEFSKGCFKKWGWGCFSWKGRFLFSKSKRDIDNVKIRTINLAKWMWI